MQADKHDYLALLSEAISSQKSLPLHFQTEPFDTVLSFDDLLAEMKAEMDWGKPTVVNATSKAVRKKKSKNNDEDDAFLDEMIHDRFQKYLHQGSNTLPKHLLATHFVLTLRLVGSDGRPVLHLGRLA